MHRTAALAALAITLVWSGRAAAEERFLAVGAFDEHGQGVRGHGLVLRRALRAELGQSGAFELVADNAAKRQALKRIKKDLSNLTDDRQWVEVGRAVGATHLLLGEVQEDRNTCLAFAQLIHLESQRTKVTLPEYYDCTRSDLVQVAGLLSVQLTGKRASKTRARDHLLKERRPVTIQMRDKTAIVDGKKFTVYEGEIVPGEPPPPAPPPPPPPPEATPLAEPTPTPPVHENRTPAIERPAPPFDVTRWPGLMPPQDGYTLYDVARVAGRYRELVISGLLVLPLVLVLLGAIVTRFSEPNGHRILRIGFGVSMLAISAELAILAFYQWVLARPVALDANALLLAAPPVSVALWLIGVRILRVSEAIGFFRQIPWTLVFAGFFLVLLLVASQIAVPAWALAIVTVLFFAAMRFIATVRRARQKA